MIQDDPFVQISVVYGLTRAFGEISSRILGVKTQSKLDAEKTNSDMQHKLELLELDRNRLDWEKQRYANDIAERRNIIQAEAQARMEEVTYTLELQNMLEQHPIRLMPTVFRRDYDNQPIPLHVVVAQNKLGNDAASSLLIQRDLEDGLLEFSGQYYSRNSGSHPLKVLTEGWRPEYPCGASAVAGLFHLLQGIPFLIIDSVAVSEGWSFRVGYWSSDQKSESYSRIGLIPTPTSVSEDTLVPVKDMTFWYKLIVALVADQLHLIQGGKAPILPNILHELSNNHSHVKGSKNLSGVYSQLDSNPDLITNAILDVYRELYSGYASAHGPLAPDVLLDLGESLQQANFNNIAHSLAHDSMDAYIAIRRGPAVGSAKIEVIRSLYSSKDSHWLLRLSDLFRNLGRTHESSQLNEIFHNHGA